MNIKKMYLIFCVLGTILPFSQFVPWLSIHGLDFPLFIQELFSTKISSFFALDVIVSAVVLVFFILRESKRIDLPKQWLPIVATFCVGVSLGLPLFLYLRQKQIEILQN